MNLRPTATIHTSEVHHCRALVSVGLHRKKAIEPLLEVVSKDGIKLHWKTKYQNQF